MLENLSQEDKFKLTLNQEALERTKQEQLQNKEVSPEMIQEKIEEELEKIETYSEQITDIPEYQEKQIASLGGNEQELADEMANIDTEIKRTKSGFIERTKNYVISLATMVASLGNPSDINNVKKLETATNLDSSDFLSEETYTNEIKLKPSAMESTRVNTLPKIDLEEKVEENQRKIDEVKKDFESQKEWLNDWYTKRSTITKFSKDSTRFKNEIPRVKLNVHTDKGYKNIAPKGSSAFADSWGDIHINMNRSNPERILHELTHGISKDKIFGFNNPFKRSTYGKEVVENVKLSKEEYNKFLDSYYTENTAKQLKEQYEYLTRPTEVYARLNVFRESFNLDPLKSYSPEEVQEMINQYDDHSENFSDDIGDLLDILGKDPKRLAILLNSLADNSTGEKDQTILNSEA
jgi:hypothetical protein